MAYLRQVVRRRAERGIGSDQARSSAALVLNHLLFCRKLFHSGTSFHCVIFVREICTRTCANSNKLQFYQVISVIAACFSTRISTELLKTFTEHSHSFSLLHECGAKSAWLLIPRGIFSSRLKEN